MHVIKPSTYQPQPVLKRRHKRWLLLPALLLSIALYNYARPLPAVTTTVSVQGLAATKAPAIDWPVGAEAAIGAPGYDVLDSSGEQTPLATASIAKVITALCVLQKQPLDVGQSGQTYTISSQDVDIYNDYVARDGSVAAVTEGEQITEYQALEALMLPSANNIADSLTRWVFGSQAAYRTYATNFLSQNGLTRTTIGNDASGYDPSTTSTATDLTELGLLALKSPVLLQIAGQHSTILPVAGTVYNYNTVLGVNGITGLKTGNNETDLGAFLFTANVRVGSKTVPVTGAVMGADSLQTALTAATQLSASLQAGFEQATIATAGQHVGSMRTAWGITEPIITSNVLQVTRWKDTAIGETHTLDISKRSGTIGSISINAPGARSQAQLRLAHPVPGPSFWWRLTRH